MWKNMKTGSEGIRLIKYYEGWSSKAYLCPALKMTIGYGHLIKKSEMDYYKGRILTEEEGESLLVLDLLGAVRTVRTLVYPNLHQDQFDALVSFVFNFGYSNFKSSTLRKVVNRQKHHEVPGQLSRWIWVRGENGLYKSKGLIRRRQAEINLYTK